MCAMNIVAYNVWCSLQSVVPLIERKSGKNAVYRLIEFTEFALIVFRVLRRIFFLFDDEIKKYTPLRVAPAPIVFILCIFHFVHTAPNKRHTKWISNIHTHRKINTYFSYVSVFFFSHCCGCCPFINDELCTIADYKCSWKASSRWIRYFSCVETCVWIGNILVIIQHPNTHTHTITSTQQ